MLNRNIKKIEDIHTTKEQQEMVRKYREFHPNWTRGTEYITFVRRDVKVEGVCCMCDELPSKLITYKSGFIERYCDKHLDRIKDNLQDVSEHVIIKSR